MRLRDIALHTSFIIQNRDLAMRRTGIDPSELVGIDALCAGLDPRRDAIPADSSWQLMKALELTAELGDAARAGRAPAQLDCTHMNFNGPPPATEAECLNQLSRLRESSVAWVQECAEAVVVGGPCIRVMTSDWLIYFVLRQNQQTERIIVHGMEDTSQYGH